MGWSISSFAFSMLIASTFLANPAMSQKRVALIIGNGKYTHESQLPNPGNDARAVAAALKRIAFDDVQTVLDGDLKSMQTALAAFARSADAADLAMVYYSGHGIEVDGQNYLLPTDARLNDAADVDFEAVSLDLVLRAADRAGKVKMLVLDACRNNPFQARMLMRQNRRSVGRGLAAPPAAATGMLVAYAARAGTTADDGPPGGNSPFTSAFLKYVEQPRVEVRRMLGLVRDEVFRVTKRQEPFTYGSLGGDEVFLNPAVGAAETSIPPLLVASQRSEAALSWQLIESLADVSVFEAYRKQFGAANPFYDQLASAKIAELKRAEGREHAARPKSALPAIAPGIGQVASQSAGGAGSRLEISENSLFNAQEKRHVEALAKRHGFILPPFVISVPGNIPEKYRRFIGIWIDENGLNGKGRRNMILVTRVQNDGKVNGFMLFGPADDTSFNQNPPGVHAIDSRIELDAIAFTNMAKTEKHAVRLLDDGTMAYTYANIKAQSTVRSLRPVWRLVEAERNVGR